MGVRNRPRERKRHSETEAERLRDTDPTWGQGKEEERVAEPGLGQRRGGESLVLRRGREREREGDVTAEATCAMLNAHLRLTPWPCEGGRDGLQMNKKKLGLRERRARGRWKRVRDWEGDCTGDSRQRLGEALAARAVSPLGTTGSVLGAHGNVFI